MAITVPDKKNIQKYETTKVGGIYFKLMAIYIL